MKKETNYPSIDKTHLKGTSYFERHPFIPSMTFSQVMDLMFMLQGNHPLVDCLDLKVSSKEFQKDSLLIAKALLELGVKPGDIVTVATPNYYQVIPVFKAANMIGAVTTYLNPLASKEEIKRYLNLYESSVFINFDKDKEYNDDIKKDTKVRNVITLNPLLLNSRKFDQKILYTRGNKDDFSFHEIGNLSQYQKDKICHNFGGKQDALILYTSGSTGKAKSLLFTNENLIASCIYLKNSTHVPKPKKGDTRWMNVVPFMYPYGFGASVLQSFLSGREVILTPNLSENNIVYYYNKKPNLIFGSPAHLEVTKRKIPDSQDLSSIKTYVSGGDYLSASQNREAHEFFKRHGADVTICNGSGTGETLGCSTNSMNIPQRPETVGQLVIGPEYIILDPETKQEVKYGEPGILCTKGKHVFKGYYKDSELTKQTKIIYNGEEYYSTGNIGYLDKNRYFTLIGRASRFYITNTFNKVYCELIQRVLSGIDIIESCAVVPKPNDDTLFTSKAYVVLKEGVSPSKEVEDYIIAQSRETFNDKETNEVITLKDYEIPTSITFLKTLPRTDSAEKVNYEYLKNLAKEEYNQESKEKEKTYIKK